MDRQREQRTAPPQKTERTEPRRSQGHEPSQTAGLALQAILAGVPLRDMAPGALEELADRIGNGAMASLAALCPPECSLVSFGLPGGEPDTAPFEVPAMECALAAPVGLTEGGTGGGL